MQTQVKNKKELLERIVSGKDKIHSYGVKRLGIFGSFARDEAGNNSDVDFFVEFYPEQKTFDHFMELGFFLEEITGRKIELVTPQSLNKFIGKYIVNEVEYVALAA
jgi:predicted nucleotidyltransferase